MTVSISRAAFEAAIPSPRIDGMGGAGTALSDGMASATLNPAAAAYQVRSLAGSWSQQFGLPEFSHEVVNLSIRPHGQPVALGARSFGSDLYQETVATIGTARELTEWVSVGLQADACWLRIADYPNSNALALSAGVIVSPQRGLTMGAVWRNLNEPRMSHYADRLPGSLTTGISVDVSDEGRLVADLEQQEYHQSEIRVGAEARVLPALVLRVGVSGEPVRPAAGLQIDFRRASFLYAGNIHPDLGFSHTVGFILRLEQ